MHFLLIISHDDQFSPTPKLVSEIVDWTKKRRNERVLVDSNPLVPSSQAVTVRIREGAVQKKAGPFAQSREKICAYALIEADSMETAVTIAISHPMAKAATIEVRQVWQDLRE